MATITSPRTESPSNNPRVTSPAPSSTNTPSTSSIDLPRPDPQPAPSTQRRNRAALRDYYNLKSKPSPQPAQGNLSRSASLTSTTSDSTITSQSHATSTTNNASDDSKSPLFSQLDTPSFSPLPFITSLLASSSLHSLLRTESALISEIRTLDGDRKALVYDNYSKLIAAVSTIGEMQRGMQRRTAGGDGGLDGVEGLQGRMGELEGMVRGLWVQEGDEEGKEGRKRRREKDVVRWVVGAPQRIEGLVGEGRREEGEMEFARVKRVLDQWEGVKGVQEVRALCQKAISTESRNSGDG